MKTKMIPNYFMVRVSLKLCVNERLLKKSEPYKVTYNVYHLTSHLSFVFYISNLKISTEQRQKLTSKFKKVKYFVVILIIISKNIGILF